MKWVIDEKIKHRLTGVVVIISMAVIFLPAVLKKSNHRLDENIRVSLKLPNKPDLPQVAIPNQEVMFESLKVARVDIPTPPIPVTTNQIAQAEPLVATQSAVIVPTPETHELHKTSVAKMAMVTPPPAVMKKPMVTAKAQPIRPVIRAQASQAASFSVQIASFSQLNNAKNLVARLKQQGFNAAYQTLHGRQGMTYQVIVGHVAQKEQAQQIKNKLASNLHLQGFVIKTAVG